MSPIHVGTSGWHYPSGAGTWNGVFYPARRPRGFDELAYYAERFDTVEVNASFYRMPEPDMSRAWLRRTPASFQFAVKLYQKFTHPDMYLARDGVQDWDLSRADVDRFRTGIGPMAESGRLAAVLAQFPPSFHATAAARDYLDWLLGGLSAYPLAVELRHKSWSDEQAATQQLLSEHHAAWVLIDEPKFESSVRQRLDLVSIADAPIAYLRLHGRHAAAWWDHAEAEDRYNYSYSAEDLSPFARAAEDAAQTSGRKVLIYFNNHFSAKSVANASVLKRDLGQLIPGDYETEMVNRYPELTGVVRTQPGLL